jgi:hypothetical protein
MQNQELISAMLDLAENAGLEVRKEYFDGDGGGLCILRGKRILFVDTAADAAEQVARTAAALAKLPELDTMFILPQIREELDKYQAEA